jgi:phenylacetate-CoA ligase
LRNASLPIDELKMIQWKRLKDIITHAYKNTVYYKSLFNDLKLSPEDFQKPEDLQVIPVLTKEIIRERLEDLRARNFEDKELIKTQTGGSTGIPMLFYRDRRCHSMRNAASACIEMKLGRYPGDKVAWMWLASRDLTVNDQLKAKFRGLLVDRRIVLSAQGMTAKGVISFARAIKRYKPKMVLAFPTAIYNYARILKEANETVPKMPPVITSAEMLEPHVREFVQDTLKCEIFDRYSSREFGEIGFECSEHNGYHLDPQSHYVEITHGGKSVDPGNVGEVIITDLLNYGMPFIRYRQGDVAVEKVDSCSCGYKTPMIASIHGKTSDTLVSPEGLIVSGAALLSPLGKSEYGIRQIQIVQEALDRLKVRLAVDGEAAVAQSYLKETLADYFGPSMNVDFEMVDSIPSESSGKYRYAISKLSSEELNNAFKSSART